MQLCNVLEMECYLTDMYTHYTVWPTFTQS